MSAGPPTRPGPATTAAELLADTEHLFDEYRRLCRSLADDEWTVPSLCPAWNVRQTIAHTVGVENVLRDWPPSTDTPPPFGDVGPFIDAADPLTGREFADCVDEVFDGRLAELRTLTDADLATPSITPVGVKTYGRFLAIRVFDLWVHERDVCRPLGRPTVDDTPDARTALTEVELSLGYIVGKRIGLPDGMSIRFDLTGPIETSFGVEVDGRAAAVDPATLDAPDVVVTADSTTFVLLACGRIDPETEIDAGRITWAGDAEWGETAARSLRFTM